VGFEKGSIRSHSVENSFLKTTWTVRRTDGHNLSKKKTNLHVDVKIMFDESDRTVT
jgi:hypothetical protein